jgi:GntR family transcriptional repressor for pyruvate dehydrogenase complex
MMLTRNALLSPIDPAKATDQVIHRIAEAISSGVLKPGDQLPVESELAAQLNVAQMTLRQALSILRELGLIETTRGRNGGSFVSLQPERFTKAFQGEVPTLDELQEITDYRMAIENETSALAAIRADRLALGQLRLSLDACVSGSRDRIDHWLADNNFHVCVGEVSKSPKLARAVSQAQYEMNYFFRRLMRPYEPILPHSQEHIDIVEAIESGDPDKAWEASNNHLHSTHKFLADLIEKVTAES